jgi:hypothetical protein
MSAQEAILREVGPVEETTLGLAVDTPDQIVVVLNADLAGQMV